MHQVANRDRQKANSTYARNASSNCCSIAHTCDYPWSICLQIPAPARAKDAMVLHSYEPALRKPKHKRLRACDTVCTARPNALLQEALRCEVYETLHTNVLFSSACRSRFEFRLIDAHRVTIQAFFIESRPNTMHPVADTIGIHVQLRFE